MCLSTWRRHCRKRAVHMGRYDHLVMCSSNGHSQQSLRRWLACHDAFVCSLKVRDIIQHTPRQQPNYVSCMLVRLFATVTHLFEVTVHNSRGLELRRGLADENLGRRVGDVPRAEHALIVRAAEQAP